MVSLISFAESKIGLELNNLVIKLINIQWKERAPEKQFKKGWGFFFGFRCLVRLDLRSVSKHLLL